LKYLKDYTVKSILSLFVLALLGASCSFVQEQESVASKPLDPKVEKLKLQTGFQAEHLYNPSEHGQGSWVSMAFDDKGRLITSDQYGALYRMELPAIGSGSDMVRVEPLHLQKSSAASDTSGTKIDIGYAQGLLYAFNSLYIMVNHHGDEHFEKGNGLYRLQDTDQNDQFDKITLLKSFTGHAGEHGPHSIILGPDKKSIYVIAGNHTDVPKMDAYRLPPIWKEDNLFPLMKDPRGHAADREAPGGWIAKTDSLGAHWELVSAGFRNPFDLAFNEAGDMFTFDSDMEWDLGMPWYRPTRICHVSSGAEFGWRTGSGKWSAAYPDNLPAVLNIGQGSPTGVIHGKDAKFPEKYRKALFAFDWSFGIIYAIHLQAQGATYTAEKEEFLSGMPLPLTDGVVGPGGALYFLTGGRRLESDLYRVYHENQENVVIASSGLMPRLTEANKLRRQLEQYHGKPQTGALEAAWSYLNHPDRFVRYAARMAVEHQPVREWQQKALNEKDPQSLTQAMVALARHGNKGLKNQMLKSLVQMDCQKLSEDQKVDLLRAFELIFFRMGMPDPATKAHVLSYLNPQYPAASDQLNRALSKILVYLDAPQVVEKTLALIEKAKDNKPKEETATAGSDLILRNPQYGLDIAGMLQNVPPLQQTYLATILSQAKSGWRPDLYENYFTWYYGAFGFKGGNSYVGFIDKARQQALSNVPKARFDHYNLISGDTLLSSSGKDLLNRVQQPEGPWRQWTMEMAEPVLAQKLENRNFERGKNMFAATSCISCHSMAGEGGNIGPDLTRLGTRFSPKDMLEAIINPNAVISDQYASTIFDMKDGKSIVGRIMNEDENAYYISQNPFAPEEVRKILKEEVLTAKASAISLMMPGLINRLNEEELKDLLAFLASGGDENHEVFKAKSNE
jgi:putative heme-binding domain-containing protein